MGLNAWHRTFALALLLLAWQVAGCARQDSHAGPPLPLAASETDSKPIAVVGGEALESKDHGVRTASSRPAGAANRGNLGAPPAQRRALLVGINDYDYPLDELPADDQAVEIGPSRTKWPDLRGALNDVAAVHDVLERKYGFEAIETLRDSEATREAILRWIDEFLVAPSQPGDIVFFYFSGHGSYEPNPSSDDADKLDETLVPHDSKLGADDIRDKELRVRFNRILDRGAALTVVLDSCHSRSAARGYPVDGAASRSRPHAGVLGRARIRA